MAVDGVMVRVRSQLGTWRISGFNPMDDVVGTVAKRINMDYNVPMEHQVLSMDPGGSERLEFDIPLVAAGIERNGDMLYLTVSIPGSR